MYTILSARSFPGSTAFCILFFVCAVCTKGSACLISSHTSLAPFLHTRTETCNLVFTYLNIDKIIILSEQNEFRYYNFDFQLVELIRK